MRQPVSGKTTVNAPFLSRAWFGAARCTFCAMSRTASACLGLALCALAIVFAGCDGPQAATAEPETAIAGETYRPPQRPVASPTARFFPPRPTATPSPTPVPAMQPTAWGASPAHNGVGAPAVSAVAALVMDEASGEVLFEKDAHRRLGPASLTKIATAVVAIEAGDLERTVDVEFDRSELRRSTLMGLEGGDQFSLRDLLYGLMLPSGNDAALAIGRALSGSDQAFVDSMNELAGRLGLVDTHFVNPHGLGRPGHYSSAYDLALLSRYAMSIGEFQLLASTRYWTASGSRTIGMGNLNPMLGRYTGADGVKTGYTRSAGKTLVVSAVRDGRRIYVVLLNAPSRESDATALLDWAFANHAWP
jgi:D-alanyl-D-alanine carboxypeptidase